MPALSPCLLQSQKMGLEGLQDECLSSLLLGPSVAMNMQTAGLEMDICDGLFQQNGACGYVLKPQFLCDPQSSFHPEKPLSPFKAQMLLVQVGWEMKPLEGDWAAEESSAGKRQVARLRQGFLNQRSV